MPVEETAGSTNTSVLGYRDDDLLVKYNTATTVFFAVLERLVPIRNLTFEAEQGNFFLVDFSWIVGKLFCCFPSSFSCALDV